jgi:hypothetical protein
MYEAPPQITPDKRNSVAFWGAMLVAGPAVAAIAPPLAVWLLGGFEDFQWVDQDVTPAQVFGIIGAMAFPFAAFFAAQAMFNQARAKASRAWPTAPGKVESCEQRRRSTRTGTVYQLALSYSYEVGGFEYQGHSAEFGPSWVANESLIDELARKYPAGTAVTVHFDPTDPQTSVLETSEALALAGLRKVWLFLALPFFFTLLIAAKSLIQSD